MHSNSKLVRYAGVLLMICPYAIWYLLGFLPDEVSRELLPDWKVFFGTMSFVFIIGVFIYGIAFEKVPIIIVFIITLTLYSPLLIGGTHGEGGKEADSFMSWVLISIYLLSVAMIFIYRTYKVRRKE